MFPPAVVQRLRSPLPELALKCAHGEGTVATPDGKKERPNRCQLGRAPSLDYGRNLAGKSQPSTKLRYLPAGDPVGCIA